VTWQIYKTMALPYSRTVGPFVSESDVARCYAATPAGALMAAAQISARCALAGQWRAVIEQQVVPGPGRDAFIRLNERDQRTESNHPGDPGQIAGFRFMSYSPHMAVIQLVTRLHSGELLESMLTVRRQDGDWRLEIPLNGNLAGRRHSIPSLHGYIPWVGV
jgi:hypothetical protein